MIFLKVKYLKSKEKRCHQFNYFKANLLLIGIAVLKRENKVQMHCSSPYSFYCAQGSSLVKVYHWFAKYKKYVVNKTKNNIIDLVNKERHKTFFIWRFSKSFLNPSKTFSQNILRNWIFFNVEVMISAWINL